MYYMSHNKIGYGQSLLTTNHRRLQQLNTSARRMLWVQESQKPKEEFEKRSLLCQRLDEWNRSNG